jgi:hypothetical protein
MNWEMNGRLGRRLLSALRVYVGETDVAAAGLTAGDQTATRAGNRHRYTA